MKKKKKESSFSAVMKRLRRNKMAMVGLAVIVLIILVAIFADVLAPYPYAKQDLTNYFSGPTAEHPLGTDKLGRDMLSRLIYGARESLKIGFSAVAISTFFGIIIGSIAGYYGGWLDNLLMRFLDVYQAIPFMLLCMLIAAALGPSTTNTIITLGISVIPSYARILRSTMMTCRNQEYVEAAIATNASDFEVIFRHVLPNAISPMIVQITMGLGSSILAASSLSFVGLGAQPPSPEWGAMISEGRSYLESNPSLVMYPGIAVMLAVLSFNMLGDGLRDALDPKLKN